MMEPTNNCFCANCDVNPYAGNVPPTSRAYTRGDAVGTGMGDACVNRQSLECRLGSVPDQLPVSQPISTQPTHGNLVSSDDNRVLLNQPYEYTRNFMGESCNSNAIGSKGCNGTVYAQPFDPRLYDSRRGQYNPLDRPSYTGEVLLKDIYNPKYNRYGKDYTSYSDIDAGQIQYYYSKDIAGAYSLPNFTQRSEVNRGIFKDPMGAIKPVYTRCPIKPKALSNSCLDDIRQSTIHRESIMEGLTAKMNQQRWSSRYGDYGCE